MSDYNQADIGAGYNTTASINSENTKIETAVNSKLDKTGGTLTNDLDMDSNHILNVAPATTDTGLVIKSQLDAKLDVEGDTMEGDIDMDGNQILNLPAPVTAGEPLRLGDTSLIQGLEVGYTAIATTTLFINNDQAPSTDALVKTNGYTTEGDGGSATWKHNGVTGQTTSQSPAQLGDALINDVDGNQWALDFNGSININQLESALDTGNDVSAANAALNALSAAGGGKLIIDGNTKVRFTSNIDVLANCSIVGDYEYLDTTDRDIWTSLGSRISLASGATIGTQNGASIKGLLIYRDGMTFPSAGLTATEVALYAGTAITVKSAAPYIGYCTVLGFDKALTTSATNTPRGRVEFCNADCTNGFEVDLDLGAWTFSYVFCQPILSDSDVDNVRTGIGFNVKNKSDWTTFVGCFAFQDIGYRITDSNQISFISCGADHPTDGTDTYNTGVGFEIKSDSQDNYFIGCQAASHSSGFQIDTDSGNRNFISGTHLWNMASTGFGYEILGGDVHISGGSIRDFVSASGKGVFVNDANSKVSLDGGLVIDGVATATDTPAFSEFISDRSCKFYNVTNVRTNEALAQVASAGTLTLPDNDSFIEVTGTTTIGTLVGAGRLPNETVTLYFSSALTVNNGGIELAGSVNQAFTAGSTLSLAYRTGNTWSEVSRSVR